MIRRDDGDEWLDEQRRKISDLQAPMPAPGIQLLILPPVKYEAIVVIAGSLHIHVRKAPSRFHRFMMRVLLGWRWEILP